MQVRELSHSEVADGTVQLLEAIGTATWPVVASDHRLGRLVQRAGLMPLVRTRGDLASHVLIQAVGRAQVAKSVS